MALHNICSYFCDGLLLVEYWLSLKEVNLHKIAIFSVSSYL